VAEVQLRRGLDAAAGANVVAAQRYFHDAADLRPWDVSVAQTAGHALVEVARATSGPTASGAARNARAWLDQVQKVLPTNEELTLDRASLAELAGDFPRAHALLAQALAADPENPAILLRIGVVQGEAGQLGAAAATLHEAARIDPASPGPWRDLAIVYREQHRPAAAAHAAAHAAALSHP
ncbi:MAG: tetratricopeptide repeat protein, partial [Acidimicrobiales bacterium]